MSAPVLLRRSGQPPLKLEGHALVASATSKAEAGTRKSRWHEIDLYRSHEPPEDYPAGTIALAVRYRSDWKGEDGRDWAFMLLSESLVSFLAQAGRDGEEFDPFEWVGGYPDIERFRPKQERLLDDLEAGWDAMVSDLLEAAGIVEGG